MPGPPDKIVQFVDLTGNTPSQNLTVLSNAWSNFYSEYTVYPNVVITVGNVVYLGYYS